jgi:hypothetical protein
MNAIQPPVLLLLLSQMAKKSRFLLSTQARRNPWIGGLLMVLVMASLARQTGAQVPSPPLFDSLTLSRKFRPDPQILRGISGGAVPASEIAGRKETNNGTCVGFVDGKPDHVLTLTGFFNYLSLKIESPADTTLVIRGPGGTWCNDDAPNNGKNPGIAGEWLAGTYEIWIGSYEQTKYHPYLIKITEVR